MPEKPQRLPAVETPRVWELITELLPNFDQLPAPVGR